MKKLKVRESILHFYQYFMFIVKTILWLIILSLNSNNKDKTVLVKFLYFEKKDERTGIICNNISDVNL